MIPGNANPLLLKSSASAQYQISRSLRFNSADSAYLSRTPASAGNRKTWTWSGWVKRSALSATEANSTLFSGGGGGNDSTIVFVNNQIWYYYYVSPGGGYVADVRSVAVFRDLSAWYHIVVAVDTTQSTAANRVRLYVNGSEVSYSSPTYPSQNLDMGINTVSTVHTVGARNTLVNYLDGYLADIHFIDGQALTPSSFGQTDATTGEWVPIQYTGTYGTNGFKLNFADNSAATAAALGKDTSGNGNNWTPTNLSVTAGAGNDSLVDTPTSYGTDTGVGGEVRGNYCTLNPLQNTCTLTNGNLDAAHGSGTFAGTRGTFYVSSGKWYWEVTVGTITASVPYRIGIAKPASSVGSGLGGDTNSYNYSNDGQKSFNGTNSAYGATYTGGDIIGVALDLDTGALAYYKNGVSQGTAFTSITGSFAPAVELYTGQTSGPATVNFGQRPFAYTAPSGFKALCDTNLPAPTIVKPSTVMDTVLYTGTGASLTPTSSLGFSPDLVWIKGRSGATDHALYDTVRGTTLDLASNSTAAETTQAQGLTAFNSNGFTVGTLAKLNTNTATYAGWCWDAGSSTVTNTAGTIQSSVRANPSAGFSVVTYTGNGTSGATVGHGLGVAPQFIIVKQRSGVARNWFVGHTSLGWTQCLEGLNTTAAASTQAGAWNNTAPTSTVFSLGNGSGTNNTSDTYVAYCFAPVAGYSAAFSWTGNNSTDGPFCFLGFRPALLLLKQTTAASATNWVMLDCRRAGYNVDNDPLWPNLASAEGATDLVDITSNGFKIRTTDTSVNASSGTYVGFAWAEFPFQYARAR